MRSREFTGEKRFKVSLYEKIIYVLEYVSLDGMTCLQQKRYK